jgi:hypothetical protein
MTYKLQHFFRNKSFFFNYYQPEHNSEQLILFHHRLKKILPG